MHSVTSDIIHNLVDDPEQDEDHLISSESQVVDTQANPEVKTDIKQEEPE